MGVMGAYGRRLRRRRLLWRAWRHRRQIVRLADRTAAIRPGQVLLVATLRNERIRLPWFLRYYRGLGVDHFLMVDNGSDDGSREYLAAEGDVSLWAADASYRDSRFGMDWLTALQWRHGHGHWCVTVDVDEFLVYPFCDTRPLRALTDWLESSGLRSFPAMLLDMYPRGRIDAEPYREGTDPFAIAAWFDPGNYTIAPDHAMGNLWIQGGPRARGFFPQAPRQAPALNKIPLVLWNRRYAYVSSTHMLLPRGLNQVHDTLGGEKASGMLLHAKFIDTFAAKAAEEMARGEHYAGSAEYRAYRATLDASPDLWCKWSEKYINWRQLEILGLMSKGNWA